MQINQMNTQLKTVQPVTYRRKDGSTLDGFAVNVGTRFARVKQNLLTEAYEDLPIECSEARLIFHKPKQIEA